MPKMPLGVMWGSVKVRFLREEEEGESPFYHTFVASTKNKAIQMKVAKATKIAEKHATGNFFSNKTDCV